MRLKLSILTLVMGLLSCVGADAAATIKSGLYRLVSSRAGGKVAAASTSSTMVMAQPNSDDLSQVWVVTKGSSTYTFQNAKTGQFINKQGSLYKAVPLGDNSFGFYVRQNPNVTSDVYFNVSHSSDFSGNSCLHDDNNGVVVVWSASGTATAGGSEWKFQAATDITEDQIRESLAAVTGNQAFVPGKIYRIMSRDYKRAMYESVADSLVKSDTPSNDLAQLWRVEASGSGYTIQNLYSGRYIQRQNSRSVPYPTRTPNSNNVFTIKENTNFKYDYAYDIAETENLGLHCAATQGYQVVGWYMCTDGSGNTASVWNFQEVNVSDEEIEAARKEYNELRGITKNSAAYAKAVRTFFADEACTQLLDEYQAMSDDDLRAAMAAVLPSTIVEMALKVKNNTWAKWEKDFRVAQYGAYSNPVYWANKLRTTQYGRQNNPTGIVADKNQPLYIFLGNSVPVGSTLTVETCNSASVWGTGSVNLKKGLNIIIAPEDNSHLFINYISRDGSLISAFPKLDIHIEGGRVNGFFDCNTRTDEEWVEMQKDGLFTAPVIDVMGEYVQWHMNTSLVRKNCPTKINRMMAIWDSIVYYELDLMGLLHSDEYPDIYEDVYPRRFNNKMECTTVTGDSYMYSTSYYTAYNENTLSTVLNYDEMSKLNGNLWGPAHEIGHHNQGAIRAAGTTEVSNNLFSNMILHRFGKCTTRYWNVQTMQPYMAEKLSWPEIYSKKGDISTMNRMYFNLYLYYYGLGIDPVFYQKVFKELRNNPLVNPTDPSITNGRTDYLRFALACCKAAKQDLSEYFEYWGFFRPVSNVKISDYSNWTVTTSASDIKSVRTQMAACGPKNSVMIFIEDRVRATKGIDGKNKGFIDTYSVANCKSEMGYYLDYPLQLEAGSNFYSVASNGVVTTQTASKNAIGFKVYDSKGNLAYVADTRKFTLPAYLVSEGDYRIVMAQSNGVDIPMFSTTTPHFRMNIYRGTSSSIVRATDGTVESNTLPTLGANDIAVLNAVNDDRTIPETLLDMTNVVTAEGTARNVALCDNAPFYTPTAFTADKLTYTTTIGTHHTPQVVPFTLAATDLPAGVQLETPKAHLQLDDIDYLIVDPHAAEAPAGTPFFLRGASEDQTVELTVNNANVVTTPSAVTVDNLVLNAAFRGFTASVQTPLYMANAEGTAFERSTTTATPDRPFVWLNADIAAADAPEKLVIAREGVTGIQVIKPAAKDGQIYDLQGRAVKQPASGIYIRNGKKILVK